MPKEDGKLWKFTVGPQAVRARMEKGTAFPLNVAELKQSLDSDINTLVAMVVKQFGAGAGLVSYPMLARRISEPIWDQHEKLATDEAHFLSGVLDLYNGIKSFLEKTPQAYLEKMSISENDKKELLDELEKFLRDNEVIK